MNQSLDVVVCCRITYKHGRNVLIHALVATRWESFDHGIIVSDAPLRDEMLFQVLLMHPHVPYKHGEICWAKLSQFLWFPGVPRKFSHDYLFIYRS